MPISDSVANIVNSLGKISGPIPIPVSFTLRITSLIWFLPLVFISEIDTKPSWVNLIALVSRLYMTWFILFSSASTKISSEGLSDPLGTISFSSFWNSYNSSVFPLQFSICLRWSSIASSTIIFKLKYSFFNFNDWSSILVMSKISETSLSNLLVLRTNLSKNSFFSVISVFFDSSNSYSMNSRVPKIGVIGDSSWAAILINSFCLSYFVLNSLLASLRWLIDSFKCTIVVLSCSIDSSDESSFLAVLNVLPRSRLLRDFADNKISPASVMNWTENDIKMVVDFEW